MADMRYDDAHCLCPDGGECPIHYESPAHDREHAECRRAAIAEVVAALRQWPDAWTPTRPDFIGPADFVERRFAS